MSLSQPAMDLFEDVSSYNEDDIEKDLKTASISLDYESSSQTSYQSSYNKSSSKHDESTSPTVERHKHIQAMRRRCLYFGLIALVFSAAASSLFGYWMGKGAQEKATATFETRANELSLVVETTWNEYDRLASSAHEICSRRGNTTRLEFTEFYEYVLADGIEVQSIQCIPKVTHVERAAHEAEAKEYWENRLPGYEYSGFTGVLFDAETGAVTGVESPESEQDIYYPIKYCEPPEGNREAIDLDVYIDKGTFAPMLEKSIETMTPVLSGRIETIQETTDKAYSVLVYHPGVTLSSQPDKIPDVFAGLVVRILTLLERASNLQRENLAVYVYDIRPNGTKEFLGAAEYDVSTDEAGEFITTTEFPREISFEDLKAQADKNRFHETVIPIASGSWSIVVLPIDSTYNPEFFLVIFGSGMILFAGLAIIFWSRSNLRQMVEIYETKAKQAAAERKIVASLFPENVRDRLIQGAQAQDEEQNKRLTSLQAFRNTPSRPVDQHTSEGLFGSKPIADFHPETTIMFADLVGFTAWSSTREPTQVFTLLEVLYSAFDRMAKRRRIFKVETVGDCYVAAAGVPVPRQDHAIAIAKFASDVLTAVPLLLTKLETSLGPDTAELAIRIGIHSGPVTSGVLRGDKGRFQLFGDAMNSASRMETTGAPGRIHVSPQCADIIRKAGKGSWIEPRDVQIFVKGKGRLQTFWLNKERQKSEENSSEKLSQEGEETLKLPCAAPDKEDRLISWMVEAMSHYLKHVMARRTATSDPSVNVPSRASMIRFGKPLHSVKDVIPFCEFNSNGTLERVDADSIVLEDKVIMQLTNLVKSIAGMYNENPFHNFEHASHVALSVTKLLSRIVEQNKDADSFGIYASVPITQFAAFFCALIHDVDHPGIPNASYAQERPDLARVYNNTSIAEQNSVDMSWSLFMRDEFKDLRRCVCATDKELIQFRQLVVQMVMATDVIDKDIGQRRKERWNKAFNIDISRSKHNPGSDSAAIIRDRKATIVLEHLIQASDVSHTMQHWHVYHKWNENLFLEMYHAYKQGRLETDPTSNWYKSEIGFFDFYVIPLAKKLEACGVFGVSSDEFLIYAKENREEWVRRGEDLVQLYLEKYNASFMEMNYSKKTRHPIASRSSIASKASTNSKSSTNSREPRSRRVCPSGIIIEGEPGAGVA